MSSRSTRRRASSSSRFAATPARSTIRAYPARSSVPNTSSRAPRRLPPTPALSSPSRSIPGPASAPISSARIASSRRRSSTSATRPPSPGLARRRVRHGLPPSGCQPPPVPLQPPSVLRTLFSRRCSSPAPLTGSS